MFEGLASADKDPTKSLHVDDVPTPELAPDEVVPRGDGQLDQLQHGVDEHLRAAADVRPSSTASARRASGAPATPSPTRWSGRDASGVVLQVGSAVRQLEARRPGDGPLQLRRRPGPERARRLDAGRQPAHLGLRDELRRSGRPGRRQGQPADAQARPTSRGRRPRSTRCATRRATACSCRPNGARHEAGRRRAGLGRHRWHRRLRRAVRAERRRHPGRRRVLAGEGRAPARARRRGGDRPQGRGLPLLVGRGTPRTRASGAASASRSATLVGEDPDIVFEHPGRQTMGASIFVCKRGGTVVTCAATSGYMVEFDNRHFWMKLKRLIASHFANYQEAWNANRLISMGRIQPLLSAVHPLDDVGEAARTIHRNEHEGKIGVLCLAPEEGLGIDDPERRAAHRRGQHHAVPPARRLKALSSSRRRRRGWCPGPRTGAPSGGSRRPPAPSRRGSCRGRP